MPPRRLNASWMRFWKSAARSRTRAERPAKIQTETLPNGRVRKSSSLVPPSCLLIQTDLISYRPTGAAGLVGEKELLNFL